MFLDREKAKLRAQARKQKDQAKKPQRVPARKLLSLEHPDTVAAIGDAGKEVHNPVPEDHQIVASSEKMPDESDATGGYFEWTELGLLNGRGNVRIPGGLDETHTGITPWRQIWHQ